MSGDVLVAETVEAVAPHALIIEFARQRERVVDPRMRPVESGVEARHLRGMREGFRGGPDAREVVRLVEGGKRAE